MFAFPLKKLGSVFQGVIKLRVLPLKPDKLHCYRRLCAPNRKLNKSILYWPKSWWTKDCDTLWVNSNYRQ